MTTADRQVVKILGGVLEDGLEAVEAAAPKPGRRRLQPTMWCSISWRAGASPRPRRRSRHRWICGCAWSRRPTALVTRLVEVRRERMRYWT